MKDRCYKQPKEEWSIAEAGPFFAVRCKRSENKGGKPLRSEER